jgi:hypothetical protein
VSNNELEGDLIALPTGIVSIDISSNKLTGSLPTDMSAYTSLVDIQVSRLDRLDPLLPCENLCTSQHSWQQAPQQENLVGKARVLIRMPAMFCNVCAQAYYNALDGELPHKLPPSLIQLALTGNSFTGHIPALPHGMKYLSLAENALEGPLPNGPGAAQLWFVSVSCLCAGVRTCVSSLDRVNAAMHMGVGVWERAAHLPTAVSTSCAG